MNFGLVSLILVNVKINEKWNSKQACVFYVIWVVVTGLCFSEALS